eukprot:1014486-Alexandrium_andersonii.AAC.1
MTGPGCRWQSHGMPRALGAPCRFTGCADRALAAPHLAALRCGSGLGGLVSAAHQSARPTA